MPVSALLTFYHLRLTAMLQDTYYCPHLTDGDIDSIRDKVTCFVPCTDGKCSDQYSNPNNVTPESKHLP